MFRLCVFVSAWWKHMKIIINIMNTCISFFHVKCVRSKWFLIWNDMKCVRFFTLYFSFWILNQRNVGWFFFSFQFFHVNGEQQNENHFIDCLFDLQQMMNNQKLCDSVESNRVNGIWVQKLAYHWAPNYHKLPYGFDF